jgi:hypothetical protein
MMGPSIVCKTWWRLICLPSAVMGALPLFMSCRFVRPELGSTRSGAIKFACLQTLVAAVRDTGPVADPAEARCVREAGSPIRGRFAGAAVAPLAAAAAASSPGHGGNWRIAAETTGLASVSNRAAVFPWRSGSSQPVLTVGLVCSSRSREPSGPSAESRSTGEPDVAGSSILVTTSVSAR